MLKAEQIPEAVVYEVFKRCEWDTELEAAEAIAAALNAWPMKQHRAWDDVLGLGAIIILPLQEQES